jgi:GT2 family glycosyltransferase
LVDNCSTDGSEILKSFPNVKYIRNEENKGFVGAVNQGLEYCLDKGYDYIAISNNDIIVSNKWLDKMLEPMDRADVGVTGLMTSDGGKNQSIFTEMKRVEVSPQKTDEINKMLEEQYKGVEVEEENSIIFCLALIKREVFKKIGLLGTEFGVGFGDDGDFNIRARTAGFKLIVRKDGFFYHYRRTTFSQLYTSDKIAEMQKNNIETLQKKHPKHFMENTKKLKILVTNNHLIGLGGSETFTYTVTKELVSRGHEVDVFTFAKGLMSNRISEFANVVDEPAKEYDLILINHNSCLRKLDGVNGYKIFTSHGIYPALEQPEKGANLYVSISEEVKGHLANKSFESELIYNGVDCERFSPKKPIRKELKKIFSLCQGRFAQDVLRQACKILGVELMETKSGQREWNIEDYINEADLVVSLGRGAYESMACGRNILVYDARPYGLNNCGDGMLTSENTEELLKNNLSGRNKQIAFDVAGIVAELKKYDYEQGERNRQFALENFDIKKQVDKYINFYITKK